MAVYKLKEIGQLNYSKNFTNESNGAFPIYATSGIVSFTNNPTFEENSIILPRVGSFNIFFSSKKHSTKNTAFSYKIDESKANSKYIYFKLLKVNLTNENMGSVVPRLTSIFWNEFKINMPSLKIQNQIIDIIKPIEDMKNSLMKQLNYLSKYSELILNQYNILERMNKNCIFVKGNSVNNFSEGKFLFLNVAAANGHPNKYCENEPNIFPKDITLSLDGNTGLVNNNLLGFNGYLYKVESKTISNWQIYYSLKHQINQNIIKLNETGTTIKHSNNSKKDLLLLTFKYKDILQKLFDLEINLKQQIELFAKQIKKTIDILIK